MGSHQRTPQFGAASHMVKPPEPAPPRRGRPALKNDPPTVARLSELGAIHCSMAEAAQAMGVLESRLNNFFKEFPSTRAEFDKASALSLERLRTAQFKLAQTSPTMAIFLGKHYLGQADRRELDASAQAFQAAQSAEAGQRLRDKIAALAIDPDPAGDGQAGEVAE